MEILALKSVVFKVYHIILSNCFTHAVPRWTWVSWCWACWVSACPSTCCTTAASSSASETNVTKIPRSTLRWTTAARPRPACRRAWRRFLQSRWATLKMEGTEVTLLWDMWRTNSLWDRRTSHSQIVHSACSHRCTHFHHHTDTHMWLNTTVTPPSPSLWRTPNTHTHSFHMESFQFLDFTRELRRKLTKGREKKQLLQPPQRFLLSHFFLHVCHFVFHVGLASPSPT